MQQSFCCVLLSCFEVAYYFYISSEKIPQALCLHQQKKGGVREGQGSKKHDFKIQMPSSVAWIKIALTSEVRKSPAGSTKSPPLNCCGLKWWMLVSTSEFQKNLSCRETGHLGTRLNNSWLCFLFSLVCLVLILLPQISQLRQQKIKQLWESLVAHNRVKAVRCHRDWVVLQENCSQILWMLKSRESRENAPLFEICRADLITAADPLP